MLKMCSYISIVPFVLVYYLGVVRSVTHMTFWRCTRHCYSLFCSRAINGFHLLHCCI